MSGIRTINEYKKESPVGLAAILAIMSVSTFKTAVILYSRNVAEVDVNNKSFNRNLRKIRKTSLLRMLVVR
jgi:hypothetical protein